MPQREVGEAAKAMARMMRRVINDEVPRNLVGVVVNASPLEVDIAGGAHSLREDENLLLSHAVRKYDHDHGLEEGDSVLLVPAGDDFLATAVVSEKDNELTGYQELVGEDPADVQFGVSVDGDTEDRFEVRADGRIQWGSGSDPLDTPLYRYAPHWLMLEGQLWAGWGTAPGATYLAVVAAGDGWPRVGMLNSGYLHFGPGNAGADTNLYRLAAGVLRSDGNLSMLGWVGSYPSGAGAVAFAASLPSDTVGNRYVVTNVGTILWGPGTAGSDTNLYRYSAGRLATDGQFACQFPGLATTKTIEVGGVDSAGVGYRLLRVPN